MLRGSLNVLKNQLELHHKSRSNNNTYKPPINFLLLSSGKPQLPLEEVINTMRDNVLRTQSQASTTSILAYDNLVEQLKIFARQINDKSLEITRLQELCKKNNIDIGIAPKPVVTTPPQSTTVPKK